ncbi:MAG: sugar phosphate isomerase/epimerase [Lachnospiraceae bacterium]|nr:sugar phosphate isomerase/epimerase [Lachnospiraceae bacterium]
MIDKIGVQLFTIRDYMLTEKDVKESFQKLKSMGYDQIQTAGCKIPYKTYGELAEQAGLEIIGTHDNFDMMCNDFENALKNHNYLNTYNMGCGAYGIEPQTRKIDAIENFIKKGNEIGEKLRRYGGKFTYHNHQHEFIQLENGKRMMDMLVEGLSAENTSFVLDTYWVQFSGSDVCEWIEKLRGRIDILHLKDMKIDAITKNQKMCEVGNGNLNWSRIIETALSTGVKYYIVEQDHCDGNPFNSLKQSSEYLHKYFM